MRIMGGGGGGGGVNRHSILDTRAFSALREEEEPRIYGSNCRIELTICLPSQKYVHIF